VTSWRDDTSASAQDDLDSILNTGLEAAINQLTRHGEFFPFGVTVAGDGEDQLVAAEPGLGEQPPSLEVLRMLVEGARATRTENRAVAFVSDVKLSDGSDAIRVEMEHREGVALAVVAPYRRRRFGRLVNLGSLSASAAEPRVWTD